MNLHKLLQQRAAANNPVRIGLIGFADDNHGLADLDRFGVSRLENSSWQARPIYVDNDVPPKT